MSDTVINMPMMAQSGHHPLLQMLCSAENCGNLVDTPAEIASYPDGNCPECGNPWTGSEVRTTTITVTAPAQISGAI